MFLIASNFLAEIWVYLFFCFLGGANLLEVSHSFYYYTTSWEYGLNRLIKKCDGFHMVLYYYILSILVHKITPWKVMLKVISEISKRQSAQIMVTNLVIYLEFVWFNKKMKGIWRWSYPLNQPKQDYIKSCSINIACHTYFGDIRVRLRERERLGESES